MPVAFLGHEPEMAQFFAVIFDYRTHSAYILERKIADNSPNYDSDWRAWNGPERWKLIANLHCWDAGDLDTISVIIRDWPQNGYDCGPIAGAIVRKFIEDGMEETWEFLSAHCMISFNNYMHFITTQPLHWEYMWLDDKTIFKMQEGGDHMLDAQLLRSLTLTSSSCMNCHAFIAQRSTAQDTERGAEEDYQEAQEDPGMDQEQASEDEQPLCNAEKIKMLMSLIKGYRILHGTHLHQSLQPAEATCRPSRTSKNDVEKVDMEGEQEQ
ncbi:hypothetical protein OG21DRAFT_1487975 [Imleria badia]|nr:hypothetical protein OG21DRAFT_1487975 [Imleria badia]